MLETTMHYSNIFPIMGWEESGAAAVGITVSMFRFMVAFFLSVGVGAGLRQIPTVQGRHLYAVLTGFFLIYYPFGNGCFHTLVPSLITYVAMVFARPACGRIAWVVDFLYLIGCHVASASGAAWKEGNMDFTGSQMVLTLKIISAAVCYQDGLKKEQGLTPYQQTNKLRRMPSLLEYLSYIFSSGSLLAGPTFELSDYLNYIERRGPWDPKADRPMPDPLVPGLMRAAKALACMGLHLWLATIFPVDTLETEWYRSHSLLGRICVLIIVGFVYRVKYYFAWTVSEAALILSGFCFNGWDEAGKARWNRYSNARIWRVETCTSAAEFAVHWNTCTGNFLRHYVYERLSPKGKHAPFWVLLVTQLVSAIWHGLFPGYMMFFVNTAFMFESAKIIYRYERAYGPTKGWLNPATNPLWIAIKWFYTAFILNYSAAPFLLIDFWPGLRAWRSVYFLAHILMVSIVVLGNIFPPPHKPKGKAAPAALAKELPGNKTGDVNSAAAKTGGDRPNNTQSAANGVCPVPTGSVKDE